MRFFLLFGAAVLSSTLAMGQVTPSFSNQQRTTGIVGITPGQTARLNIFYPTAPAPILQVLCSATIGIGDDQGGILQSKSIDQLRPGTSVSLDMNADVDLAGKLRTEIHGNSVAPNGCHLVATLEIIDNATQKTVLVVGSQQTYPPVTKVIPVPAYPVD